MEGVIEGLSGCDVSFLPIVSAYAREIGIVDEINRLCPPSKGVDTGKVCPALIPDTLTGRSPLFRLKESFEGLDLDLLLGGGVRLFQLNDDAVGRVPDDLYGAGTNRILTAVGVNAVKLFDPDTSHAHHDTASHSVYGAYSAEEGDAPFRITYGFSKDKRPDLKQLVHSLLCVDDGIPIYSKCEDGNKSDKEINRNLIREMTRRMKDLGQDNFVYVADSALVTRENLRLMDDEKNGFRFLSRLPMTFRECGTAIRRAVRQGAWKDLGRLAQNGAKGKRKAAHYHGYETVVTIDGIMYRALVVHSDAHDERRLKKLSKEVDKEKASLERISSETEKISFACLPDAVSAARRLPFGRYHELDREIVEVPRYGRGRPRTDGTRRIVGRSYKLSLEVQACEESLEQGPREAGCFVPITNEPFEEDGGVGSLELLRIYKEQHSIERNFGFLKDPLIVNALFLKSPQRMEALGLILVPALMVWRLMERTMRITLKQSGSKVTGWDGRRTSRPTSFMMTTKFGSVLVLSLKGKRMPGRPLTEVQEDYLRILGLSPEVFVNPETRLSTEVVSRN